MTAVSTSAPEGTASTPEVSRVSQWLLRREGSSPWLKQAPITALFLIALVLSELLPGRQPTHAAAHVLGLVLVALATVAAVVISRSKPLYRFERVVPALDFLAVGLLRYSTGEAESMFAPLMVLPMVWFAASPGRRYIVYGFAGTAVAYFLPVALDPTHALDGDRIVRAAFAAVVLGVAAFAINELSLLAGRVVAAARQSECDVAAQLEEAALVQRSLQPVDDTPAPGWEVAGDCLTSRVVSGDFYDWYDIHDGFAVTLGDVMGKGVAAGMIAATARATIRSHRRADDPVVAVSRASASLATELEDTTTFATMFHARVRTADGTVRYVDAGHGLSMIVHPDGSHTRLASFDLPLGLAVDESEWTTREAVLRPGELLVTVSDGILDRLSGDVDSLRTVARLARSADSAQGAVDTVLRLARDDVRADDVTVVVVRHG